MGKNAGWAMTVTVRFTEREAAAMEAAGSALGVTPQQFVERAVALRLESAALRRLVEAAEAEWGTPVDAVGVQREQRRVNHDVDSEDAAEAERLADLSREREERL